MDEQLAAIYGTGQVEEDDLEKTAAAELLVKLAEEQGVDLNDFSDAEVGEMLDDLYNNGIEHTAENEKVAEADYLGRVMAHSMVQELNNIEKEAGNKFTKVEKLLQSKPAKWLKGRPEALRQAGRHAAMAAKGTDPWNVQVKGMRGFHAGKALKGAAPELAAAGTLAAGTAAALKGKKKKASAFETLAEQRAYELAQEAGYVKEASAFDMELERRALEICEENGIPVDWNE